MTRIKILGAAAIVSAVIAAPAFGQQVRPYVSAPYERGPVYYRSFDVPPGSYAPRDTDEYWNERNFGFSGRDPFCNPIYDVKPLFGLAACRVVG